MLGLLLAIVVLCANAAPVQLKLGRTLKPINRDADGIHWMRNPYERVAKKFGMDKLPMALRKRNPAMFKSFPLRGNWTSLALWYMVVQLGQSNQTFHVQVDTGSSDVGVPDVSCSTCGSHTDTPWDPTNDGASPAPCNGNVLNCNGQQSTCNNNQCQYSISYGDGSGYTANVYSTALTFGSTPNGGIEIPQQYVGSIVSEVTPNGPFEPPVVDGIAGFAQTYLSVVGAPTMISQLSANNPNCPFIFSMCGDVHHTGGVLTVCGQGNNHVGPIKWTPMIGYDTDGFYNIYIQDFAVNGQRLGIDSSVYNQNIHAVDSGTTLMLLPNSAFAALKQSFLNNCSSNNLHGVCDVDSSSTIFDNSNCFSFSASQLAAFPVIQLYAGESSTIEIDFPVNAYLVPGFCSDPTQYSLSIQSLGSETGTLLGDPIMLGNEVTYDVVNKRMGFATKSSSCIFGKK